MNGIITKNCEWCNSSFHAVNPRKRFCSKSCSGKVFIPQIRKCQNCQTEFMSNTSRKKFCSKKCCCAHWFSNNPERAMQLNKAWYENNRDHLSNWKKSYRKENASYIKQYNKEYHEKNKESINARQKDWKKEHPEAGRAANRRRRARKLGALGDHTPLEFAIICKKQRHKCAHCGEKRKLAEDHIVPLSRGGTDFAYNIQGLCISCNSEKRDKILSYAHPSLFDTA